MKGFIKFIKLKKSAKLKHRKDIFAVVEKKSYDTLGYLTYNHRWRTYVFEPDRDTFYDSKCLQEIVKKLEELKSNPKH